jgi:hypothetical protein
LASEGEVLFGPGTEFRVKSIDGSKTIDAFGDKVTVYYATLEIVKTRATVKALLKAENKPDDAPITAHYDTGQPWGRFGWVDEDVTWFDIKKD